MKKLIIGCIIVVMAFMTVYGFSSMKANIEVEKVLEVCNSVEQSVLENENKILSEVKGSEKIDKVLEELRATNDREFNLSEYFSNILLLEDFKNEVRKEQEKKRTEETTDEDIEKNVEKIYNSVINNNPKYVEEETIYTDESGDKVIKVSDLRRLDSNDGIVRFYNGEYIISSRYIPMTYDSKRNTGFPFDIKSITKDDSVYIYKNESTFCGLEIQYDCENNKIVDIKITYIID